MSKGSKKGQMVETKKTTSMKQTMKLDTKKPTIMMTTLKTTATPTMSPTEKMCKDNPTAILPHPDHCARYVDCSRSSEENGGVMECPYPMLWDVNGKRCEHHELTKCGSRFEPIDPCKYKNCCSLFNA